MAVDHGCQLEPIGAGHGCPLKLTGAMWGQGSTGANGCPLHVAHWSHVGGGGGGGQPATLWSVLDVFGRGGQLCQCVCSYSSYAEPILTYM